MFVLGDGKKRDDVRLVPKRGSLIAPIQVHDFLTVAPGCPASVQTAKVNPP